VLFQKGLFGLPVSLSVVPVVLFDGFRSQFVPVGLDHCVQHNLSLWADGDVMRLLRRHLEVMVDSKFMASADAYPGFPTDISASFNVLNSFKILPCSRLLWGPRS